MNEAGWHPDPHHRHELRWWDGAVWTDHVSDHGVAAVDPVSAVPPPVAASFGAGALPPPAFTPPTAPQAVSPTVVQPVTGPPTVVPVQPGGAPPEKSGGRGLWVAAVLGVLVIGVGVAVALSLGGDDDQSAGDDTELSSDDTDPDDTEPDDTDPDDTTETSDTTATTVAPTVVVTTAPPLTLPVTVAPVTVAPTVAPVTVAPTVAPVVPTVDVLVAALPTASEAPQGFTPSLEGPDTELSPSTGQGFGMCGGGDADTRAQAANVIARAWSASYDSPSGLLWVGLFSFPTPDDASAFLSSTATQATTCGAGLTYQVPESEWDIFSDDLDATWTVIENAGAGPATAPADEAFQLTTQFASSTRYDGVNYTSTAGDIIQYERYGSIVLLVDRTGNWNLSGFGNIDPAEIYQPTPSDVAALADVLRGPVLDRLRAAGVIA